MGFVIFAAMGLYLLISLGAVTWAVSHAKKNGKNVKKWGWGAALVMYLIPLGLDTDGGGASVLLRQGFGVLGLQDAGAMEARESGGDGGAGGE